MRELPILFSGPMVKAILDNRKTQTRRIEGLKILNDEPSSWRLEGKMKDGSYSFERGKGIGFENHFMMPRYHVGDELWVRETWAADRQYDSLPPRAIPAASNIWFPDQLGWKRDKHMGKVRSGRFMPKKFARIWLEVTGVKDPHQIQNISEEDAKAEGIDSCAVYAPSPLHSEVLYIAPGVQMVSVHGEREVDVPCHSTARSAFECLWDSLHNKPGERFQDNPWVFPYEFKRIKP